MEKQLTIREQLGLKQEELALLLQVTRSQLSLYEIGKRKLPTHATEKLATLLSFAQSESETENLEAKNEPTERGLFTASVKINKSLLFFYLFPLFPEMQNQ